MQRGGNVANPLRLPVRDVIVIGGGISGTAAAYELARTGVAVTLLEKGDLASMASGWTLAGVRQSGRDPAELPLAMAAVLRWAELADELGTEVEYRQEGNLRLARTSEELPIVSELVRTQRALGLDLVFLPDAAAVRAVAPALADTVRAASYCRSDGHANPTLAVRAFAAAAERHGAAIRVGVEVKSIHATGGRVHGVATTAGPVAANVVVVAAGVHSAALCETIGLALPLTVRHATIVQTVPLPPLVRQVLGVANADFAGRQEVSGRFRMSGDAVPWRWPSGLIDADSVQPSAASVAATIARGIAVLPALESAGIARVWGGLIDMTPDGLPILGCVPEVEGLVLAAGFSGHGFCLGPATGQIVRELVTTGQASLPLAPFRWSRFAGVGGVAATTLHG
jgi:sarcosine oxidase, subunit beta